VLDVPVGVVLVACWLLVSIAWAHIVTGLVLIGWIVAHLLTWLVGTGSATHRIGSALVLVLATAMAVSGLLRWAGVPPRYAVHATSSYLLLSVLGLHLWAVRRQLRARLRVRRVSGTVVRTRSSSWPRGAPPAG
jgi:hypothetical protein